MAGGRHGLSPLLRVPGCSPPSHSGLGARTTHALLPPPSSPPSPSLLLPPPSSPLSPPPPSPLLQKRLDGHGTTARAIRHARSPQRVRRRAQGWARHHSESDPTRPIPAEGSPAGSRMGTARSDTPNPRRGFAGELKDGHGTTARAIRHARSPQRVRRRAQGWARHHSESDPTRPIPAEGSAGELKDGHGTTARAIRHARSPQRVRRRAQGWARHHSESDPTRPIPAEGSPASSRMGTAPQRERSRHARSPQRVHRSVRSFARHHSESDPTRPIPAEGASFSSQFRTAPQRERSDTPDPRRGCTTLGCADPTPG